MKKILFFVLSLNFYLVYSQEQGLIQQAYESFQKKEYQKAIEFYSAVLQKHDKYAPAYYGRGLAYAKLEQCKSAIKDFESAIQNDKALSDAF
ncbi:MAG: hypothetical protein ACPLRO_02460, partial [Candidatus Kapaibacteriota bacterium]